MANTFKEGSHWRDTARPVRLFMVNSSATFPIVFSLFHLRYWTILLALAAVVALTVLEYYGFSLTVFARYLRSQLAGRRRLAIPWWM
ncbi:MAG: IcmT/TraK family protein [Pseudomonadota bacterium]|nr:IcmT/TraK family protein [Pseudomonadota bacterium]